MKFIILGLLFNLSVILAFPSKLVINEELNDAWNAFKIKFEKSYEPLVELTRRLIWEENLKYIQQHNLEYDLGKHSYYLGVNQFSDMTNDEFKARYLTFRPPQDNTTSSVFLSPENIGPLPSSVNWTQKGYVTPVKDQRPCGSCWAFASTGALEGQYFRKNGRLVSFSEQQLVDCSGSFGNDGCSGGFMNNSFEYVKKFGIESETSYPYTAIVGPCKYNKSKVVTYCSGFMNIIPRNEVKLKEAVATVGPIAVAIDASHPSFKSYKEGIYNEIKCSATNVNHALLIVGYGNENGKNYWFVKNSWGITWGKDGYIKMSKDKQNQCGIASLASYPLM